ncbi:MAG: Uncharacterised protein [Cryomorphaceae bacterium]|nr:MAG: Uncharacterised protein [Cryomorphaceae bacterium]
MVRLSVLFALLFTLTGCRGGYSFTGGNVGEAKSIHVGFFENNAQIVNPEMSQIVTEGIKDIFMQQTSLSLVDGPADMDVRGSIVEYSLKPQAARGPSEVAQMRFTIGLKVAFENVLEPKNNFDQRFNRYRDYDADLNFSDIETELADDIIRELTEDILNRSIANW